MKAIKILLLLLLSQTQICYSQRNNPDSLFNRFRNDMQIEQKKNLGVAGMNDDETRESYYLLLLNSSINDLVKYTNDTNAYVRSVMFSGLLRKKVKNSVLLKILDAHKNDTIKFTIRSVDVVQTWSVNEYMQLAIKAKSEGWLSGIDYKKEIEKLRRRQTSLKIKIDGIHHDFVDKEALMKLDSLSLTSGKLRIVSFTLFVGDEKFIGADNVLTGDMKLAIKKAVSGYDLLSFGNIMVVGQDNKVHKLPSMVLWLK
jgi:hypothetical protein